MDIEGSQILYNIFDSETKCSSVSGIREHSQEGYPCHFLKENSGWRHPRKPRGVSRRPKSLGLLLLVLFRPLNNHISFANHKLGLVLLASCPITAADESSFKVSLRKGERMALEAILV